MIFIYVFLILIFSLIIGYLLLGYYYIKKEFKNKKNCIYYNTIKNPLMEISILLKNGNNHFISVDKYHNIIDKTNNFFSGKFYKDYIFKKNFIEHEKHILKGKIQYIRLFNGKKTKIYFKEFTLKNVLNAYYFDYIQQKHFEKK